MTQFVTKAGAQVIINPASFIDAIALKNAVASELSGSGFDFDIKNLSKDNDIDFSVFIKAFLKVDSSPAVYAALFKCLGGCTRNKERITEQTFEEIEARADYYEIIIACAKENIAPFFNGLLSMFGDKLEVQS